MGDIVHAHFYRQPLSPTHMRWIRCSAFYSPFRLRSAAALAIPPAENGAWLLPRPVASRIPCIWKHLPLSQRILITGALEHGTNGGSFDGSRYYVIRLLRGGSRFSRRSPHGSFDGNGYARTLSEVSGRDESASLRIPAIILAFKGTGYPHREGGPSVFRNSRDRMRRGNPLHRQDLSGDWGNSRRIVQRR